MRNKSLHIINERIGENLRLIRQIHNLTQTQLGEILGVTFQQVQKYEKGMTRVQAAHLKVLNQKLKVPYTDFFEDFGWEANGNKVRLSQSHFNRKALSLFLSIEDKSVQQKALALLKTLSED